MPDPTESPIRDVIPYVLRSYAMIAKLGLELYGIPIGLFTSGISASGSKGIEHYHEIGTYYAAVIEYLNSNPP